MSRRKRVYAAVFYVLVVALVVVGLIQCTAVHPIFLLGIPLGWVAFGLHTHMQKRRSEDLADRVVKELLRTSREDQPSALCIEMSQETTLAQVEIEQRLRASEPVIVRSKLRFIARPTQADIQEAVQDDAVIIVRVPVPERWRKKLDIPEIHRRITIRCNAVLQELDLIGGHPRVVLLADTCDSKSEFTEKVYERFGG